jgi:opacity protein-like surface antigen
VTTITAFAPQISLNFGTENGWSYVGAGYGAAEILTSESGVSQPASRRNGWIPTINVGAGARWFFASRLGLGFDIRFYRASGRSTGGGTPPATFTAASVGLSLR